MPAGNRAMFDELLGEARQSYRIRDERVLHGDALASASLSANDRLGALLAGVAALPEGDGYRSRRPSRRASSPCPGPP